MKKKTQDKPVLASEREARSLRDSSIRAMPMNQSIYIFYTNPGMEFRHPKIHVSTSTSSTRETSEASELSLPSSVPRDARCARAARCDEGGNQNSSFLPPLPSQQNPIEPKQKQQSTASNKGKKTSTNNKKQAKNNIKHPKHAEKSLTSPKKSSDHAKPRASTRELRSLALLARFARLGDGAR